MAFIDKPLSVLRATRAMARLVKDPTRLDEVFRLADTTEASDVAETIRAEFEADPRNHEALRERPRIGEIDLDALGRLPEGTLGRTFADFARARGIDPRDIEVNEVRSDFDYIRAHLRETHDVWHVATGFDTDVAGELGLQAFYLAQFRAPLAVMLLGVGFANTLFYAMDDREARMDAITRGWLLGRRVGTLFGVRWADHWARPLTELRAELGLDLAAVEAAISDARTPSMPTRHAA